MVRGAHTAAVYSARLAAGVGAVQDCTSRALAPLAVQANARAAAHTCKFQIIEYNAVASIDALLQHAQPDQPGNALAHMCNHLRCRIHTFFHGKVRVVQACEISSMLLITPTKA